MNRNRPDAMPAKGMQSLSSASRRRPAWSRLALLLLAALAIPSSRAADFAPVEAHVDAMLQRYRLPGAVLLIAQHGEPVHGRAFGSYTLETRMPIASASKWITASVLQRLVDFGELDWDRPIREYAAEVPVERGALTLRQLMALTSGVPGGTASSAAPCVNAPFLTLEDCALQILQLAPVGEPGEVFDYGANAMQVAAWIAESATGRSWEQLFRDNLAAPLGWEQTDYGVVRGGAVTNPRVASSVYSTAPEYLELLLFQQGHGRHDGKRLFERAGVADAHRLQTAGACLLYTPYPEAAGYALGRWVDRVDAQGHSVQVSSPSAYGFTPWIDLRLGIAAVFAVQADIGGFTRMRADLFELQRLVAKALDAEDAETEPAPFADFGGVWWNPAEAGAGLLLDQNVRGTLVLSWYTFDDEGRPLRLVANGHWLAADRWEGQAFRADYAGRDALRVGVDPAAVATREFGRIELKFSAHGAGALTLRTAEYERVTRIERFAF